MSSPSLLSNNYKSGDYITFNHFSAFSDQEYSLCRGKIVDTTNPDLLEVNIFRSSDNNLGETIVWVNPLSIVDHYTEETIKRLSVRLLLKEKWKDFIFREVKTVKTKDPYLITSQYVNSSGFVRTNPNRNVFESQVLYRNRYADLNTPQTHYRDYFGFTTDRPIRNNDIYYNQEIFFSKKCFSELELVGSRVSGNFSHRRGYNGVPPAARQYVCGLVEQGEKGLFYRKWFICSKEFLTLWTMICESDHYSLKRRQDGEYVSKTLEEIMREVDTSHYNMVSLSGNTGREFISYNLESVALYAPDTYSKLILAIFCPERFDGDWSNYAEKLRIDMLLYG